MSIFDKWTELDFSLALRRIEAAHGSAIFDKFAYLDPQRALLQIETALGVELDDVAGVLNFSGLDVVIDAAVEDSTPEWVPANAKIYIDLVNDRAWTEADGEVAIDTLLGADANTENAGWTTSYDPENLTADGYSTAVGYVAFIGSARTKLTADFTYVIQVKNHPGGGSITALAVVSEDGNDGLDFSMGGDPRRARGDSFNGDYDDQIFGVSNLGAGSINRMAVTVTATRAEFTHNGSDPEAFTITEAERPSGNPLIATLFGPSSVSDAFQSITIYDALPSTAGLMSALSETGVTNTAPHSLIIGTVGESFTRISDTEVSVVDDLAHSTLRTICEIAATDDDGNPLTYTVTDDAGGRISILEDFAGGGLYLDNTAGLDHVAEPTINFTFRATDPGGLYVEQEFTITVTAPVPDEIRIDPATITDDYDINEAANLALFVLYADDEPVTGSWSFSLTPNDDGWDSTDAQHLRIYQVHGPGTYNITCDAYGPGFTPYYSNLPLTITIVAA